MIARALTVAALVASARVPRADDCATEGVRIALEVGGASSQLEIAVRTTGACTVDLSRLALATSDGAAPTIAVATTFVDHERVRPVLLADGATTVSPRAIALPSGTHVVAMRLLIEGTERGLRVELPRESLPAAARGARVERRVKAARDGQARFGRLGELAITATPPGPAGGVGPTGPLASPLDRAPIEVAFETDVEAPQRPIAAHLATLDLYRAGLPRRTLAISPEANDAWDEIAHRAYAAALHGDAAVAAIGAHTLAWLGGGLSMQRFKLTKGPSSTDAANAPAAVVDAIGDIDARLDRKLGARGRFLPLGRPSTLRAHLAARPWDDPALAKAARDAVARLSVTRPEALAGYAPPALVEGAPAPVDPPALDPNALDPNALDTTAIQPTDEALPKPTDDGPGRVVTESVRRRSVRSHARWTRGHAPRVAVPIALVIVAAAVIATTLRERPER
jgi:hypothetical protein